jgi:hypothetical protein
MVFDCSTVRLCIPVSDDNSDEKGWYKEAKWSSCSSDKACSDPVVSSLSSVACDIWDEKLGNLSRVVLTKLFVSSAEFLIRIGCGACFEQRINWSLTSLVLLVASLPSGGYRSFLLAKMPVDKLSVRSKHEWSVASEWFICFGVVGLSVRAAVDINSF